MARGAAGVIADAAACGATDIHFDPADGSMLIRRRVDGVLRDVARVTSDAGAGLLSELAQAVGLTAGAVTHPLRAQGTVAAGGQDIEIRVALTMTVDGLRATVRLLAIKAAYSLPPIAVMGLPRDQLAILQAALHGRPGLILLSRSEAVDDPSAALVLGVDGGLVYPVLHSCAAELADGTTSVVTIEASVTKRVSGITQTQLPVGLSMAEAIAAALASDLDVLLVDPLDDGPAAEAALMVAETGHMVLAAITADDGPVGVTTRMAQLGIDEARVAGVLRCFIRDDITDGGRTRAVFPALDGAA